MKFILLRLVIYLLSYWIPIKKELFIFGCWNGKMLGDNPKAIYDYMCSNNIGEVYWFTYDRDIYLKLKKEKKNVMFGCTIKNIITHMQAEAVFCNCSVTTDLLGFSINRKTKVFNLWHGTPMKMIGEDAVKSGISKAKMGINKKNWLVSLIKKTFPNRILKALQFDIYYLSSSEVVSKLLVGAMGIDICKIIKCGYPKLDICFSNLGKIKTDTILYAPTYRGDYKSETDILTQFNFDIDNVNHTLKQKRKKLFIRLHPANYLPLEVMKEIDRSSNIFLDKSDNVYESLASYSLIITDFSSIYFDALAINANVLLAPFGYKSYIENDRPLYYSPDDLYPYKKPGDWKELLKDLDEYLENKELTSIREMFYEFPFKPCSKEFLNIVFDKLQR